MIIPRRWYALIAALCLVFVLFGGFFVRNDLPNVPDFIQDFHDKVKPPSPHSGPKYKPQTGAKAIAIVDNFPLAAAAHSIADLPPIPRWNSQGFSAQHPAERTPLFIGFTRNWRLLQQVVVSYITAGWPPSDIYVIENTGVMDANKLGQLSIQNPFFLNHTRLELLGVNVLITPTLLTFAQLQNFYLWTSTMEKYPFYFWSHMDVVAVSMEDDYAKKYPDTNFTDPSNQYKGYKSVYDYCIEALHEVLNQKDLRWAMRFFSYDRLALVNVSAFREIGGWDTQIPFYMTDCDMHARIEMAGLNIEDKPAGLVYDVASSLDDLIVLYRKKSGPNGYQVPEAKFIDPNILEEELVAIAEGEEQLRKAGMGFVGDDLDTTGMKSFWEGKDAEGTESEGKFESKRDTSNDKSTTAFDFAAKSSSNPQILSSGWVEDTLSSPLFAQLTDTLDHMQNSKSAGKTRNSWQARQTGGQGDPFYRDSAGFEQAIIMTIDHGRAVFREKWGHRDCDIVAMGLRPGDAWRVEHDWRD